MGTRPSERRIERAWESQELSGVRSVQSETPRTDVFHVQATAAPEPVRAQPGAVEAGSGEPDELDIPAFLRRGH